MNRYGSASLVVLTLLTGVAGAGAATAAEDSTTLGEIVVTAQKTEQSLQNVSLAISALGAQQVEERRVRSIADLQQQAPGLTVTSSSGTPNITMRGIGLQFPNISGEPGVAFNVDGVYIGRPVATGAIFNDLERIEILRGPQGTLYGRNAIGGVVNVITRSPTATPRFDASLTYGSHDNIEAFAGVEGPIAGDRLLGRLSVYTNNYDNTQRNLYTGKGGGNLRSYAFKGVLVANLSDDLKVTFRGDSYQDTSNANFWAGINELAIVNPPTFDLGVTPSNPGGIFGAVPGLRPTQLPLPRNGKDFVNDAPSFQKHRQSGGSIRVDWSPGAVKLTSITAYRTSTYSRSVDVDATSANIFQEDLAREHGEQFSQEFNLSGRVGDRFDWLVGLYAYREKARNSDDFQFPGFARVAEVALNLPTGAFPQNINYDYHQKTKSYAGFTQVTAHLTPQLDLTGGVRYTRDEKDVRQTIYQFSPVPSCLNITHNKSWDSATWKAGLDYRPQQGKLLYASVTTGYKAGGFNLGGCDNPFNPEKLTAYEAGAKLDLFEGRARLNLAAFYYDYSNFQANIYTLGGATVKNAEGAKEYGGEAELIARLPYGFEASSNLTLLHSAYRDFFTTDPLNPAAGLQNFKGNRLERTPKYTVSAALGYRRQIGAGDLALRYEFFHSASFFNEPSNSERTRSPSYSVSNVFASYDMGKWEVGAFGKNVFDKRYTVLRLALANAGIVNTAWAPGAWWGVYAKVHY